MLNYAYTKLRLLAIMALLGTSSSTIWAQGQEGPMTPLRSSTQANLAPFYHGVASGDPLPDRVILWTRVTTDSSFADVTWRIALDTGMTQLIDSGVVRTNANKDFTIKVDVAGLQPNTFYFYEFQYLNKLSVRGRTRTLPVGSVDSLRFAVVSCSNFDNGYFNAYNLITSRNDIDVVLHLGDYIYEYGNGQFGSVRNPLPATEIITLNDYRMRHSHYKLDEDLMRLHQQYPFITVWDDHETANDSWMGGAQNHTPGTEGDWLTRKSEAIRAYFEWMPLRQPDPVQDTQRIYRRFRFGDLIELHMLDTRLQGREQQNGTGNTSPTRTLLGFPQFDWLIEGMDTSTARWQILGQQVMMGPLNVQPLTFLPPIYPNADQWDGYSGERKRLYDSVMARNISNMVVLTGDIHTAWAMDLPMVNYVGASGANSAGVEFVTTAVTSQSSPLPISISVIQSINPHIKFADLTRKGYLILDVNRQRTQGDFYFVSTISQIGATETLGASWFVNNGERFLRRANSGSVANPARVGVQAPLNPRFTGSQDTTVSIDLVAEDKSSVLLGIYPNPFMEQLQLHYTLQYDAEVSAMVVDMQGRTVWQWEGGQQPQGIHRQSLQPQGLSTGSYVLVLRLGKQQYQRILVKQ